MQPDCVLFFIALKNLLGSTNIITVSVFSYSHFTPRSSYFVNRNYDLFSSSLDQTFTYDQFSLLLFFLKQIKNFEYTIHFPGGVYKDRVKNDSIFFKILTPLSCARGNSSEKFKLCSTIVSEFIAYEICQRLRVNVVHNTSFS